MRYYLTTYDSTVLCATDARMGYRASEFAETLKTLSQQFAEKIGVKVENIEWQVPMESSCFSNKLLLMAQVDADWQPTEDIFVIDGELQSFHNHLVHSVLSVIHGGGKLVNINDYPPKNPHRLFRSK
jgi:hypothetical protein